MDESSVGDGVGVADQDPVAEADAEAAVTTGPDAHPAPTAEEISRAADAVLLRCAEIGLAPFLMSGSALGAARHNGPIHGDKDLDLGFFVEGYTARDRARLIGSLLGDGAQYVHGWTVAHAIGTQDTVRVHGVPVDLHVCPTDGLHRLHYAYIPPEGGDLSAPWRMAEYRFSRFGTAPRFFAGRWVSAPCPLDRYLREHFGDDYMTPATGWHWAYSAPACTVRGVWVTRRTTPEGLA